MTEKHQSVEAIWHCVKEYLFQMSSDTDRILLNRIHWSGESPGSGDSDRGHKWKEL